MLYVMNRCRAAGLALGFHEHLVDLLPRDIRPLKPASRPASCGKQPNCATTERDLSLIRSCASAWTEFSTPSPAKPPSSTGQRYISNPRHDARHGRPGQRQDVVAASQTSNPLHNGRHCSRGRIRTDGAGARRARGEQDPRRTNHLARPPCKADRGVWDRARVGRSLTGRQDTTLWIHIFVQTLAFGVLFPLGMVLGVSAAWARAVDGATMPNRDLRASR